MRTGALLVLGPALSLALGCAAAEPGGGAGPDDPFKPGLAFAMLPAAAHLNGRFEVVVRINGPDGRRLSEDSSTTVSVRASGQGRLQGMLARKAIAGTVAFNDLSYDSWGPITLTVSAPGFTETTTRAAIPVRPLMRFVRMPPGHVPAQSPVGPFVIELVDGRGRAVAADQKVSLEATDPALQITGGPERTFRDGQVIYESVVLQASGSRSLVWRSAGLGDLVHPLTVHEGQETDYLWLPGGRVGVPYRVMLPGGASEYRLLKGALPRGLRLEPTGEIHGLPSAAQHARLEIFAVRGGREPPVLLRADLPVFADSETAAQPIEALDADGRFGVGAFEDSVPVPSRRTSVRVRFYHPTEEGRPAPGPFPVIVFHHGAALVDAQHPRLYDRFDPLLRRWASHGFVVATIDALDLVWVGGRLLNPTQANLNAMSENQRATITFLRTRGAESAGFPLSGRLDLDRVLVAGHSRGGAASLITARAERSVVGGILIKPLDPLATVGGERVWSGPLPAKPFLLVIAGNDNDLPYPMVDFLFERRAGPMTAVTILGSVHFFTCDVCPADPGLEPTIPRAEDWAVTNAYAVAFLRYVAQGDLGHAPLLFGRPGQSTRLARAGVLVRADRAAAPLVVDDFQHGVPGRNRLGLPTREVMMDVSVDEPSMLSAVRGMPPAYDSFRARYERPENLAWSGAHRLEWSADGARYVSELGELDVRGRGAFVLGLRSETGPLAPERVSVRFRDAEGVQAAIRAEGHVGASAIATRLSDLIVPLREVREAGVDLANLASVELLLQGAGALVVDDLRFE